MGLGFTLVIEQSGWDVRKYLSQCMECIFDCVRASSVSMFKNRIGNYLVRVGYTHISIKLCGLSISHLLPCLLQYLTRFTKIAIQGTPQMAVDKEARAYRESTHTITSVTFPDCMCNPP